MFKNIFYICFLSSSYLFYCQNTKQLENRKVQIQQEIQEYQNLIRKENRKEKSILTRIEEQDSKIKLTERLIKNSRQQANSLDKDIFKTQDDINNLNKELESLKRDYAKMIVKSYKNKISENYYLFILSSESFSQAYKRTQYMKQYATYRRKQGLLLEKKKKQLEDYYAQISMQKDAKQKIIQISEQEKSILESDIKEQEKLIASVQKDKTKIIAQINQRQRETKKIDNQINNLIREAIRQANIKAKRDAEKKIVKKETLVNNPVVIEKPVPKASEPNLKVVKNSENTKTAPNLYKKEEKSTIKEEFNLTVETKAVSDDFKTNKGKLIMPVEKGFLTLGYGDQPHPAQKNLIIHNSGIEITTPKGGIARAVFEGEVMAIQKITDYNKAVYIQHGDYITVYLNLSEIYISKGQKVKSKQKLGKILVNSNGNTVLKFLVLQNTTILNPELWLSL